MINKFHQKIYSIGAPYFFAVAILSMIALLAVQALGVFETTALFLSVRSVAVAIIGLCVVYFSLLPFSVLTVAFGALKAAAIIGALQGGYEEIAELAVLMLALLGLLEYVVVAKVRRALGERKAVVPATALVKGIGGERRVPVAELHPDDSVVVREGERVPADGVVTEGEGLVSEYALTRETRQTLKRINDRVYASSINENGAITMRVTASGDETVLARTVAIIERAAQTPTKPMRIMTRAGIALAGGAAVLSAIFLFVFEDSSRAFALALVVGAGYASIFVPAMTLYSILEAANFGFLVRGAKDIKRIGGATRIVLDTTERVTYSERTIASVRTFWGATYEDVFSLASGLESFANDRYSLIVCEEARKRNIIPVKPKKLEVIKGKGVKATVDGVEALVGNETFINLNNIHIQEEIKEHVSAEMKAGFIPLLVVRDHKIIGVISISDTLQPSLKVALTDLVDSGVKSVFMTKKIDHDDVRTSIERGPERIRAMRHEGEIVLAMGDGVEDAEVLSAAHVGIIVQVSDKRAALESPYCVLLSAGFESMPRVVIRFKRVMKILKQSTIAWGVLTALGVGAVCIGAMGPLGAALWYLLSECALLFNGVRLFPKKERERLSFTW